jgi:hypothetical protein
MRGAEERRRRYVRAMASGNVIDPVLAATLRAEFLERIDDNLDTPGALRVADRAAAALMTSTTTLGADAVAADELMTSMLDVIGVMFEPAVA